MDRSRSPRGRSPRGRSPRGRSPRSPVEEKKGGENPQIFVARLPRGLYERDLEDIFAKFGKITFVKLKRGFAFIVSV